jgi:hypothetical protein
MKVPLAVAKHEIGHALTQRILGIGPQHIKLCEANGLFTGQSLPLKNANSDENYARLLTSEMAGPIAQICTAPESLESLESNFSDSLLIPALGLSKDVTRPLNALGWESDLIRSQILFLTEKFQHVSTHARFYERGGFVFDVERQLFAIFKTPLMRDHVSHIASSLVERRFLDGKDFGEAAIEALQNPSWATLITLDLNFSPFKLKNPS